jgi:sterol desaturase/sphingolipid hydroxylase (fatty acid hydroxylase superfamily)
VSRHAFLDELMMSTLVGSGVYATCALIVVAAEGRRDAAVYRTRSSLNDLAYAIFYQCSIYAVLVMPLYAFLLPRMQFLRVGLLARLPPAAAFLIWWITFDFLSYWVHRLQHAVRPLWEFHSIHHSPTQLTLLTSNRVHVVEQLYVGVLMIIPAFVLGVPQGRWLPMLFLQVLSETLQHARLNWSFGPLHRVLVSPTFHSFHHSAERSELDHNYGRYLSLWDFLFGTYTESREPVLRVGVDGMEIPERLTAQFLHPFRYLIARTRRRPSSAPPELIPSSSA